MAGGRAGAPVRSLARHTVGAGCALRLSRLGRAARGLMAGLVLKENSWDDKFPAGLRVLVVDDDPLCLKVVEHMLKRCKYAGELRAAAVPLPCILRNPRPREMDWVSCLRCPAQAGVFAGFNMHWALYVV